MMKYSRLFLLTVCSFLPILGNNSTLHASGKCQSLTPVGGEPGQMSVDKTASPPSVPIGFASLKRDNWNTDFAIPSNNRFKRYVGILTPRTGGTYSVRMYLKYSNGSADEVYGDKPNLTSDKPLEMSGSPRVGQEPYQVNIFVGDAESIGKSYEIKAIACQ